MLGFYNVMEGSIRWFIVLNLSPNFTGNILPAVSMIKNRWISAYKHKFKNIFSEIQDVKSANCQGHFYLVCLIIISINLTIKNFLGTTRVLIQVDAMIIMQKNVFNVFVKRVVVLKRTVKIQKLR